MTGIKNVSFSLTQEHMDTVCKPGAGKKTCRFLIFGTEGFSCGKFTWIMSSIAARMSEQTMIAQGDNCDALLGEIMKHKNEFIGKKVLYEERAPTYRVEGVVKDITMEKEKDSFEIHIDAGEQSFPQGISLEYLEITKTPTYFQFEVSGIGAFAGSTKIFI